MSLQARWALSPKAKYLQARFWISVERAGQAFSAQDFDVENTQALSSIGRCSTRHVVAVVDQDRDAAKKRVAGAVLVESDVCRGKALRDHVHDLRDNVSNFVILFSWSVKSKCDGASNLRWG
jgi:hypothetical protein